MKETETITQIGSDMYGQAEKFLNHLAKNLWGALKISYQDEESSSLLNFIESEQLMVNINFIKIPVEEVEVIELVFYKLFPEEAGFEIVLHIDEENKLYDLIPVELRHALRFSALNAIDVELTL